MNATIERVNSARERARPFAAQYPFEPHFAEVGGAQMHYVDEGPRGGDALLFLHGNPTWSFLWRNLIKELRSEQRCIAPDHVGCGLSEKPQSYDYRLERHVDNLERLVAQLGLRRITLVVHDWGGAIGFGFAVRRPELVARLVVMNTAVFPGPCPLRIRVCRTPLFGPLAVRGFNAFARAASVMASEVALAPEVKRGLLAPYSSWSERIATLRFVQDIPLSPADASWATLQAIESRLELLAAKPMVLIWGERDWCFTPFFREEWQRRFPRASVRIAQAAGHWVMEDERERVTAWLREFLEAHPLAP